MLKQLDAWQREENQSSVLFAQKLAKQLDAIDGKLDTLINGFLEGIIDKVVYLKKKEALINEKQSLKDKKKLFEQKGQLWFEPLRDWVKTADGAGKLNPHSEIMEIKEIIEKLCSNRLLGAKKIGIDFTEDFLDIAKQKGLGALETYNSPKIKTGKPLNTKGFPVWWWLLQHKRTVFEQRTMS